MLKDLSIGDVKELILAEINDCERKIRLDILQFVPLISMLIIIVRLVFETDLEFYQMNFESIVYWSTTAFNFWWILFLVMNTIYRNDAIKNLDVSNPSNLDLKKGLWGHLTETIGMMLTVLANYYMVFYFESPVYLKSPFIISSSLITISFVMKIILLYRMYIDWNFLKPKRSRKESSTRSYKLPILIFIGSIVHILVEQMYMVSFSVFILGISIASFFVFINLVFTKLGTVYEIMWLMELSSKHRFEIYDNDQVIKILEEQYVGRFRTEIINVEKQEFVTSD